jgi:hypothetical protein
MFFKSTPTKIVNENILNNYKYENKNLNDNCDKLIKQYNLLNELNEKTTAELESVKKTLIDVYKERDNFKTIIYKYEDVKFVAIENDIIKKQKEELEIKKHELLKETKKFETENKTLITKKSTVYLRKNEQEYLTNIINNMINMKIQYDCVVDSFCFSDLESVKEIYSKKGKIFYWRMDKKEDDKKFYVYHFYLK